MTPLFRPFLAAFLASVAICGLSAAQSSATATKANAATEAKPPTELVVVDRLTGDGPAAARGEPVLVHYTGYLWDASAPDNKGKEFDSSIKRSVPFGFIVGAGRVIQGWDEGVPGMKVGGQRTLVIPPEKGYGEKGSGASIPPNSTLIFDVELMGIIGKTQQPKAEPSPYVPAKNAAPRK
jgi:FKBP-type peptidyl-prolyl cis-trans isomerase FkpA